MRERTPVRVRCPSHFKFELVFEHHDAVRNGMKIANCLHTKYRKWRQNATKLESLPHHVLRKSLTSHRSTFRWWRCFMWSGALSISISEWFGGNEFRLKSSPLLLACAGFWFLVHNVLNFGASEFQMLTYISCPTCYCLSPTLSLSLSLWICNMVSVSLLVDRTRLTCYYIHGRYYFILKMNAHTHTHTHEPTHIHTRTYVKKHSLLFVYYVLHLISVLFVLLIHPCPYSVV